MADWRMESTREWSIDWLMIYSLIDQLINWLIDFFGWLIDWLTDWMIACLTVRLDLDYKFKGNQFFFNFFHFWLWR